MQHYSIGGSTFYFQDEKLHDKDMQVSMHVTVTDPHRSDFRWVEYWHDHSEALGYITVMECANWLVERLQLDVKDILGEFTE